MEMNIIKKIKRTYLFFNEIYQENYEDVLDTTIRMQRHFSGAIFIIFLVYTISMLITDQLVWQEWHPKTLFGFLISGTVAVNWWVFKKQLLPRGTSTISAANSFLIILLFLLITTIFIGDGYVSDTLIICTILGTSVIHQHPLQYFLIILTAGIYNTALSIIFLELPFYQNMYYQLDTFIILFGCMCINLLVSILRYELLWEKTKFKKEATKDTLTGLNNRRYFEQFFEMHHQDNELSAMLHMDLDNFKTINDSWGHKRGDEVLSIVAGILRKNFRKMDCIARVGGDEFMVFMPLLSERKFAVERVQKTLDCFPVILHEDDKEIPVSISIGIVFLNENENITYQEAYHTADTAMYQAKQAGKGKAVIWEKEKNAYVEI